MNLAPYPFPLSRHSWSRSGAQPTTERVLSSSPSRSSPVSQCLGMIRRHSAWRACVRALALGLLAGLLVRLTLAEVHYARGWQPGLDRAASLAELEKAAGLYPFLRRFREGPALRERVR